MKLTMAKVAWPYALFALIWLTVSFSADEILPRVDASAASLEGGLMPVLWRIHLRGLAINFAAILLATAIAARFGRVATRVLVVLVGVVWIVVFCLLMVTMDNLNPDPAETFFSLEGALTYDYWPLAIFSYLGILASALVSGYLVNRRRSA